MRVREVELWTPCEQDGTEYVRKAVESGFEGEGCGYFGCAFWIHEDGDD